MADDANTSTGVISSVFGFVTRELGAFVTSATGGVPVEAPEKEEHRRKRTGDDASRRAFRSKTRRNITQSAKGRKSSPSAYAYEAKLKNSGRDHRVDPNDAHTIHRGKGSSARKVPQDRHSAKEVGLEVAVDEEDDSHAMNERYLSSAMPPPRLPFPSPIQSRKPSMPGSLFARSPTPAEFRRHPVSLYGALIEEVERPLISRHSNPEEHTSVGNALRPVRPRSPTPPRPSPRRRSDSPSRHVRFDPHVVARTVPPPETTESPESEPELVPPIPEEPEVKTENDDDEVVLLSEPPPCFDTSDAAIASVNTSKGTRNVRIAERRREAEEEAYTLRTKGSQGDVDHERIRQLEEEIERLKAELAQRPLSSSQTSFAIPPPPPPPPPPPTGKAKGRVPTSSSAHYDGLTSPQASPRLGLKSTPPLRRTIKRSLLPTVPAASMEKFLSELKTVKLRSVGREDASFNTSVGSMTQASICVGLQNLKAGLKRRRDLAEDDDSVANTSTAYKRRFDAESSFANTPDVEDVSSASLFFSSSRPNVTSGSLDTSRSTISSNPTKAPTRPPRINNGFVSGSGRRIPPSAMNIPPNRQQIPQSTRLESSKLSGFAPSDVTTPSLCSDTEVDQDQYQDQDVLEDEATTPPMLSGLEPDQGPQRMSEKALGKMKELAPNPYSPEDISAPYHSFSALQDERPLQAENGYAGEPEAEEEEEDVDLSIPPLRRPPHRPIHLMRSINAAQELADRSVTRRSASSERALTHQRPDPLPDSIKPPPAAKPLSKSKHSLPVHGSPSIFSIRLPTSPLPSEKNVNRKPKPPGRRVPTPMKISFTSNSDSQRQSLHLHSATSLQLRETTPDNNDDHPSALAASIAERGSPLPPSKTDKRNTSHDSGSDKSLTLEEEIRRISTGAPSQARLELERELADESGVFTGFGTKEGSDMGFMSGGGAGGPPVLADISSTSTSSRFNTSKRLTAGSRIPVPVSRSRKGSHSQIHPPVM